jgi:hypothetical protein
LAYGEWRKGGQMVDFVKRTSGSRTLTVGTKAYRFVGVNRYNLANGANFACGDSRSLDYDTWVAGIFSDLKAKTVNAVRLWAFQSFSDFGAMDRFQYVIDTAKANDIRVILVLENHNLDCTVADSRYLWIKPGHLKQTRNVDWYDTGYTQIEATNVISYKEYVEETCTRFSNEPSVLAWQLMNEAECADPAVLSRFADDISKLIKGTTVQAKQLVSLGTIGPGRDGLQGADYQAIHNLAKIDLLEVHDYGRPKEPMPGALQVQPYVKQDNTGWTYVGPRNFPLMQLSAGTAIAATVRAPSKIKEFGLKFFNFSPAAATVYCGAFKLRGSAIPVDDWATAAGWSRQEGVSALTAVASDPVRQMRALQVTVDAATRTKPSGRIVKFPVPTSWAVKKDDLFEVQLWVGSGTAVQDSSMAQAFKTSVALAKPIFVGEAGIAYPTASGVDVTASRQERADWLDAKMKAALTDWGAAGYMAWQYMRVGDPQADGYQFDGSDPIMAALEPYGTRYG